MASIKIKSSNSSSRPSSLGARELGIWSNNLYFGNSSSNPVRLLTENEIANTTDAGIIKVGQRSASTTGCLTSIINSGNDTLYVEFPSVSESSGLYTQSKTIYAMDGTWVNRTFTNNAYSSLSMSVSSNRNLVTRSNFNTAYLYPTGANSEYPVTVVIACFIGNSSYDYNIIPVNSSGSTTATYQMKSSSWDNIELKVGGWLVYTCKPIFNSGYSTNYLWNREVYYHD